MSKIEKYSKVVSAVGWSLFIIVFFVVAIWIGPIIWRAFRFSVYRSPKIEQRKVVSELRKTEKPKTKMITFDSPIIISESDYVMVPIGQSLVSPELVDEYKRDIGEQYALVGSYYGQDYNNILFAKKDGSDSHLLLDKKASITQFVYPRELKKAKKRVDFLLFGIVDKDYNRDGFLTSADAVTAYISDFSGKNLFPINPDGTKFLSHYTDKDRNLIYVTFQVDGNKDFRFNALDQVYMVEFDIKTRKINSIIIGDKLIQKIKNLVF